MVVWGIVRGGHEKQRPLGFVAILGNRFLVWIGFLSEAMKLNGRWVSWSFGRYSVDWVRYRQRFRFGARYGVG